MYVFDKHRHGQQFARPIDKSTWIFGTAADMAHNNAAHVHRRSWRFRCGLVTLVGLECIREMSNSPAFLAIFTGVGTRFPLFMLVVATFATLRAVTAFVPSSYRSTSTVASVLLAFPVTRADHVDWCSSLAVKNGLVLGGRFFSSTEVDRCVLHRKVSHGQQFLFSLAIRNVSNDTSRHTLVIACCA